MLRIADLRHRVRQSRASATWRVATSDVDAFKLRACEKLQKSLVMRESGRAGRPIREPRIVRTRGQCLRATPASGDRADDSISAYGASASAMRQISPAAGARSAIRFIAAIFGCSPRKATCRARQIGASTSWSVPRRPQCQRSSTAAPRGPNLSGRQCDRPDSRRVLGERWHRWSHLPQRAVARPSLSASVKWPSMHASSQTG